MGLHRVESWTYTWTHARPILQTTAFVISGKWSGLSESPFSLSRSHSLAAEHRLSSCGPGAELLRGTWDLPGPGIKSTSPALADDSHPLDHQANPSTFILFGLFSTLLAGEEAEVCRGTADIT